MNPAPGNERARRTQRPRRRVAVTPTFFINNGLLTFFFLAVGLEIKRQADAGVLIAPGILESHGRHLSRSHRTMRGRSVFSKVRDRFNPYGI